MTLAEIRKKYPEYDDLSDQQLADAFYNKFYADMPRAEFDQKIGIQPGMASRFFDAARPETSAAAFGASAVNSALLGIPEMAVRAMGGGQAIDATRAEYPYATTGGDIAGLLSPAALARKGVSMGISRLGGGRAGGTKYDTAAAIMQTEDQARAAADAARMAQTVRQVAGPSIPQMAGTVARRTAELGGAVVGAQAGAGQLGAARSPGNYGGGFQQGAQTFQGAATNFPGLQLIPGGQTAVNTATSLLPAGQAYGSMMYDAAVNRYIDTDRQIREEAARRALQGQQ